jgi:hypothetical protein
LRSWGWVHWEIQERHREAKAVLPLASELLIAEGTTEVEWVGIRA